MHTMRVIVLLASFACYFAATDTHVSEHGTRTTDQSFLQQGLDVESSSGNNVSQQAGLGGRWFNIWNGDCVSVELPQFEPDFLKGKKLNLAGEVCMGNYTSVTVSAGAEAQLSEKKKSEIKITGSIFWPKGEFLGTPSGSIAISYTRTYELNAIPFDLTRFSCCRRIPKSNIGVTGTLSAQIKFMVFMNSDGSEAELAVEIGGGGSLMATILGRYNMTASLKPWLRVTINNFYFKPDKTPTWSGITYSGGFDFMALNIKMSKWWSVTLGNLKVELAKSGQFYTSWYFPPRRRAPPPPPPRPPPPRPAPRPACRRRNRCSSRSSRPAPNRRRRWSYYR